MLRYLNRREPFTTRAAVLNFIVTNYPISNFVFDRRFRVDHPRLKRHLLPCPTPRLCQLATQPPFAASCTHSSNSTNMFEIVRRILLWPISFGAPCAFRFNVGSSKSKPRGPSRSNRTNLANTLLLVIILTNTFVELFLLRDRSALACSTQWQPVSFSLPLPVNITAFNGISLGVTARVTASTFARRYLPALKTVSNRGRYQDSSTSSHKLLSGFQCAC